ncbi:hypothetical protein Tco_0762886 [Tanacetum coccineum]
MWYCLDVVGEFDTLRAADRPTVVGRGCRIWEWGAEFLMRFSGSMWDQYEGEGREGVGERLFIGLGNRQSLGVIWRMAVTCARHGQRRDFTLCSFISFKAKSIRVYAEVSWGDLKGKKKEKEKNKLIGRKEERQKEDEKNRTKERKGGFVELSYGIACYLRSYARKIVFLPAWDLTGRTPSLTPLLKQPDYMAKEKCLPLFFAVLALPDVPPKSPGVMFNREEGESEEAEKEGGRTNKERRPRPLLYSHKEKGRLRRWVLINIEVGLVNKLYGKRGKAMTLLDETTPIDETSAWRAVGGVWAGTEVA